MIQLTRLNGQVITVNALFIEMVEETPDTIITLTTGKKIVVREGTQQIRLAIQDFLGQIGLIKATVKHVRTEEDNE